MSYLRNHLTTVLLFLAPGAAVALHGALEPFPRSDVRLHPSPFLNARDASLDYILAHDPDRLLASFRREAGLEPRARSYGNWENTGLDGHTAGHYLTALALMKKTTGDSEAARRLDYMIDEIARCQEAFGTGYVGGVPNSRELWEEIRSGDIRAGNFSLNDRWVPWYNLHKTYAGLYDAWKLGGNERAREVLIELCDWTVDLLDHLDDEQMRRMLVAEHGGMNEVLADAADATGDERYLEIARRFSHRHILDPLLEGRDALDGLHANTQIPKVIGFQRVAEVDGDEAWSRAAAFFWERVAHHRSVAFGGHSVAEFFHPADDFSSMLESVEGPETCNTYNMLKLSRQLHLATGDARYAEFYERATFNHILSSLHPEHGGLVYFTPARPRHYRVYSQPEENFWCCVGTGLENHARYGELIYARSGADLYVNLFIASELTWDDAGLTLTQETRFPEEERTVLKLDLDEPSVFNLMIRHPEWIASGDMEIRINGETFDTNGTPGDYLALNREWTSGDEVSVALPMRPSLEFLPDGSSWAAVMHGPLVMAAKTSRDDLTGLIADGSRMGHVAAGPLRPIHEAPVLVMGEDDKIDDLIRPVEGDSLRFRLDDAAYPPDYAGLELIPFYRLHDARYMMYWHVASPDDVDALRGDASKREAAQLELEERTLDRVRPGQQQPESEHNLRAEDSETGVHRNRHWRHAAGWFSYELQFGDSEPASLFVTYYGGDSNRHFDILIDGEILESVHLDGSAGDRFFDVEYPIPPDRIDAAEDATLTVTFRAHDGSIAGGVYDVRLLRE